MTSERYEPTTVVPTSVEDALARWDNDWPVFSIEMGGLGPGYEQTIQTAVIYALRRFTLMPEPPPDDADRIRDVVRRFVDDGSRELDLTGAMVGAAVSLASAYLVQGWQGALDNVERERHIQITKRWPQEPGLGQADQGMRL